MGNFELSKKCPLHLCGGDPLAFLRRDLSRSAEKEIMGLTTGKTWLFLVSAGEGWSTKDGVLKPAHVWDSVYDTYHMNALRIEDSGESDPRSWKESFTSTAPVSWSHHLGKQVMSCSLKAKRSRVKSRIYICKCRLLQLSTRLSWQERADITWKHHWVLWRCDWDFLKTWKIVLKTEPVGVADGNHQG